MHTQVIQSDLQIPSEPRGIRRRIQSESDDLRLIPIGSDKLFVGFFSVGFRSGYCRKRNRSFPTETSLRIRENSLGSAHRHLSATIKILQNPVGTKSPSNFNHLKTPALPMWIGLFKIFHPKIVDPRNAD